MSQSFTRGIPIDTDGNLTANSNGLIPTQKAVKSYVDSGLSTKQATLTGSESVLLPERSVLKNNTTISHTGTLTETLIYSVLIPSGTFQSNDDLRIFTRVFGTANANVKTIKMYFNDTNDLTTPTQIATVGFAGTGNNPFVRNLVFKNSLTSQEIILVSGSVGNDESNNSATLSTLSIDFTIDQYFIVTATLSNIADTMGLRNIRATLIR